MIGWLTSLGTIPKMIGIAVLAGGIGWGAGYLQGKGAAQADAENESLRSTIEQLQERGLINEDVQGLSDCELVIELGGVCSE